MRHVYIRRPNLVGGHVMNGFKRFVIVVDWILAIVVSVCGIAWTVLPGSDGPLTPILVKFANGFGDDVTGKLTVVMISGILLLLNVLLVIRRLRQSSYQRSLRFQNPSGEVFVHLGAVEECLTRSARGSEDVHDVRVRIFAGTQERPIKVVVAVSLWDAPNVPSIVEKLQEQLKGRFMEILNSQEPVDVVVTLKRLVTKKEAKRKVAEPAASPIESGFRGPEYPRD